MSTYPASLPGPSAIAHSPKARNFSTDLEGPASYANRERDLTRDVTCEFFLTAEQSDVFYRWWRDDLLEGGRAFNCSWPSLVAGPAVAQFTSEPSFSHVYMGAYKISAALQIRGASRPVLPRLLFDGLWTFDGSQTFDGTRD